MSISIDEDAIHVSLNLTPFVLLAGAGIFWWMTGSPNVKMFAPRWDYALIGLAAGAGIYCAIQLTALATPVGIIADMEAEQTQKLQLSRIPKTTLIARGILAGFTEETLFRGALQAAFTPIMGVAGAIGISNVAFGLCHSRNAPLAIATAAVGIALGLLFAATGSLIAAILAHATINVLMNIVGALR